MVKHLPTMQETRVGSLGREDPLEKEMAPHSSTIVWKIPWTEEPGRLQSMGSQRVGQDWATSLSLCHALPKCASYKQGVDSLEKTLMLGGIGGRRRRGRQRMRWQMASPTRRTWVWVNSGSWWWTGRPGVLRFMGSQRVGHDWATELDWTEQYLSFVSSNIGYIPTMCLAVD